MYKKDITEPGLYELYKPICLVTKAWSNGGALRALVFALAGSNPAPDNTSFVTQFFNVFDMSCLITKVWSNGGASRALVFALVGSNPTSDKYFHKPLG